MIIGDVQYMFMEDDTVEDGLARLAREYPNVTVTVLATSIMGTIVRIEGHWEDVFRFFLAEYEGCDGDDMIQNIAAFRDLNLPIDAQPL